MYIKKAQFQLTDDYWYLKLVPTFKQKPAAPVPYWQQLILFYRFSVEVNEFLSNVLLFDIIIFQILNCLPPLQLILVST